MTDLDLMSDFTHEPTNDVRQIGDVKLKVHKYIATYNRTLYDVELLSGKLPEDHKPILRAFGAYAPFWGSIHEIREGHYRVTVFGSD